MMELIDAGITVIQHADSLKVTLSCEASGKSVDLSAIDLEYYRRSGFYPLIKDLAPDVDFVFTWKMPINDLVKLLKEDKVPLEPLADAFVKQLTEHHDPRLKEFFQQAVGSTE